MAFNSSAVWIAHSGWMDRGGLPPPPATRFADTGVRKTVVPVFFFFFLMILEEQQTPSAAFSATILVSAKFFRPKNFQPKFFGKFFFGQNFSAIFFSKIFVAAASDGFSDSRIREAGCRGGSGGAGAPPGPSEK